MKDLALFADVRDHLIRHDLADTARTVTLDDDARIVLSRNERELALFVQAATSVQASTFTAKPSQYLHLQARGVLATGHAVMVTVLLDCPESDLVVANVPVSVEVPLEQLLPLISAAAAEDRPAEAVGR